MSLCAYNFVRSPQPKKPTSKSYQSCKSTNGDLLFTGPKRHKSIFWKQFYKHPSLCFKHEQSRIWCPPLLFTILRVRVYGKTENTEFYIISFLQALLTFKLSRQRRAHLKPSHERFSIFYKSIKDFLVKQKDKEQDDSKPVVRALSFQNGTVRVVEFLRPFLD